jgi:DNA-binding PadR family transcriptional regulator
MTVLLLLSVEPLHPYGLRQRIRDWGKDLVVNVSQPNAVYQTIDRLERSGLIAVRETTRQENRPERTVYEATEEGANTAKRWLQEMLSTPAPEYPEFPAALGFVASLSHDTVLDALESRVTALQERITSLDKQVEASVAEAPGGVDRIYLIENEYQQAIWQAERTWVLGLIDDLRSKRMTLSEG